MKNTIKILLIILLMAAAAEAKTVKLSDYATPNDGNNDTSGFQSALDAVRTNGGGTVMVPEGTWEIRSQLNLVDYGNYVSYVIQGEKGAILRIDGGSTDLIFYGGNINHMEFRDLIFIGNTSDTYDASYLGFFLYTMQLKVSGCQFYGLRAKNDIFYTGNVDAVYENNQFGGSAGDNSSINADVTYTPIWGVTVTDNIFYDYGNFKNVYYSKVSGAPWIKIAGGTGTPVVTAQAPRVVISRSRFDEGAGTAIDITNIPDVTIENSGFNVSGVTGGTGIKLSKVTFGLVQGCSLGYTSNSRPALTLVNNTSIKAARLKFGGGVYFASIDGTSSAITEQCPAC